MTRYFVSFTISGEIEVEAKTEEDAKAMLFNNRLITDAMLLTAAQDSINMRGDDAITIVDVESDEE